MKIVCIVGSMRKNSFSSKAALLTAKELKLRGHEAKLLELKDLALPFCNGSADYPTYPDFLKLKQEVASAKGFVIVTPEYHGSLSGVLKNALDLLEEVHFKHKPIALISVVGGVSSNNAINTLRIIFRQLHAWVLPEQMIISNAENAFDNNGEFVDPFLLNRLQDMTDHLLKMADKLS